MESRMRTTGQQFITMIEFMESHGDLSRPQSGPQGRLKADRLWSELSNLLNSLEEGEGYKTTEKWKKVWADLKSKTKKKALLMKRHTRGTGGGPNSNIKLSSLEERVLFILGTVAVEGDPSIDEEGISESSLPPKKKSKPEDLQHDVMVLAREHFKKPENEFDVMARNWAFKLRRMAPDQRRLAEKFINDILFEGEEGNLSRNSVTITQNSIKYE